MKLLVITKKIKTLAGLKQGGPPCIFNTGGNTDIVNLLLQEGASLFQLPLLKEHRLVAGPINW